MCFVPSFIFWWHGIWPGYYFSSQVRLRADLHNRLLCLSCRLYHQKLYPLTKSLLRSMSSLSLVSLTLYLFNPQCLIVNSPSGCYKFPCKLDTRILVLVEGNNFYPISMGILLTCLLDNVWILQGEVNCWSLLGVKGLTKTYTMQQIKEIGHSH